MSEAQALLIIAAAVVVVAGTAANALILWVHARAARAFTVAIGQAQQLSLVGLSTSDAVRSRHELESDLERPNRPARVGLLDDTSEEALRAAARAGREPNERPREYNANTNAEPQFREPESEWEPTPT